MLPSAAGAAHERLLTAYEAPAHLHAKITRPAPCLAVHLDAIDWRAGGAASVRLFVHGDFVLAAARTSDDSGTSSPVQSERQLQPANAPAPRVASSLTCKTISRAGSVLVLAAAVTQKWGHAGLGRRMGMRWSWSPPLRWRPPAELHCGLLFFGQT